MVKNTGHFSDGVWDTFFGFIFPDEENLTRDDVRTELHRLGIDLGPSLAKLQQALKRSHESEEARATLDAARQRRPSILAKLTGIAAPSAATVKEALRRMIAERLSGSQQAVYARKLESAASDEDMRSLLEDMSRLDAFSAEPDDAES